MVVELSWDDSSQAELQRQFIGKLVNQANIRNTLNLHNRD